MDRRYAPPRASAMLEALRGMGYSTETALADIIDNSITAGADSVELMFSWDGSSSRISILDNGHGMDERNLDLAMRLGEKNPLDHRNDHDLGRFGLGLKTASFSQCRRLTVASVTEKETSCLRWDLDLLGEGEDGGWYLLEGPESGSESWLEPLYQSSQGTIVLWENMDRIITPSYTEQNFLDLMDRIEAHLAMVFHRFLEGPHPDLRISMNGRRIKPWDPFMRHHPSKPWQSPPASAPGSPDVVVECHVLPHGDRLSPEEYETAQGPGGWSSQQGFYVYRNRRLLVAGSWLGLGRGRAWIKDEAHRLSRIRLDISNQCDNHWQIDIRKSTASPPASLRYWLTAMAEATRNRARKAFAHRGKTPRNLQGEDTIPAWQATQNSRGMHYRVNREHPAIRMVLNDRTLSDSQLSGMETMLRIIEETVPVQRIWLDTAENRDPPTTRFDTEPDNEVMKVLMKVYTGLIQHRGMKAEEARQWLHRTDPFQDYPSLIDNLPD